MKILLLEDDILLSEIISEHLLDKNYDVSLAYSGDEALELTYENKFDLFLFDVNVPNLSGFELLKQIRKNAIKTPAIFITSAKMLEDMQKGFEVGCDDYIKKPFELKELDLRIENIKRLYNISPSSILEFTKEIFLDNKNLELIINDKSIKIALKEKEVLMYLYRNKDKTVSIEELSSNVWAYEDSPQDSTIRTYIKNLRKILGEDKIINTRGVGYRFNI